MVWLEAVGGSGYSGSSGDVGQYPAVICWWDAVGVAVVVWGIGVVGVCECVVMGVVGGDKV